MTRADRAFVWVMESRLPLAGALAFVAFAMWFAYRSPYSGRNMRQDIDALDARVHALEAQKR